MEDIRKTSEDIKRKKLDKQAKKDIEKGIKRKSETTFQEPATSEANFKDTSSNAIFIKLSHFRVSSYPRTEHKTDT